MDSILQYPEKHKVISKRTIPFNGHHITFYIFYNPVPERISLTKYIRNKPEDFFIDVFGKISGKNIRRYPSTK
ncbi:MAG: hypothetical protein ACXWDO_12725 [Bacteroidia bacterium]